MRRKFGQKKTRRSSDGFESLWVELGEIGGRDEISLEEEAIGV
jgi:hypothetical protein